TAGANDSIAPARSYALHERITASNGARSSVARTVGGDRSATLPDGLAIVSPASASRSARAGRTRNVTSRPASSSRPPKYPPVAPAPTTRKRMAQAPFGEVGTLTCPATSLAGCRPAGLILSGDHTVGDRL